MALTRRTRPNKYDEQGKMQVAVNTRDQRMINMSTALKDERTEYIGLIGVGTNSEGGPQFQARVVFDTGSTNLWVASSLCKSYACKRGRHYYDPAKSLTQ